MKRFSISAKFFIIIFFAIIITDFTTTYFEVKSLIDNYIDEIEQDYEMIVETYEDILSKAVWTYDYPYIDSVISSIFRETNVSYVELAISYGHETYMKGNKQDGTIIKEKDLIVKSYEEEIFLGDLIIGFSEKERDRKIKNEILETLRDEFIKVIIIGLALFLAFKIFIISRLEKIEKFLLADKKDKQYFEQDSNKRYHDEIDTMIESINTMQKNNDIMMERLKDSKARAEIANTAKSQFLANMSHEIRTPMNGIVGMAELLSISEISEEQKSYVEAIVISANNLLDIINDILDISKIEAGKVDIENEEFEIEKLLDSVLYAVTYNAHKKNIELVCDFDESIPQIIESDQGKIRQVLINLLGNAVKFTENGTILFEVEKTSESQEGIDLTFTITDTGIGIDDDIQVNLFQPFVQGDLSYTKKYQGTGLGLAISKRFVELMGGTIGFESKVGFGSKFFFTVPIRKSYGIQKDLSNLPYKELSVLFIDDNALNRKITHKMLEKANIRNYTAKSGADGIRILNEKKDINFILLDVSMPEQDGFQTAKIIREKFGTYHTILMFSSVDIASNENELESIGANGYIVKPIRRRELLKKIFEVHGDKYENESSESIKEIRRLEKKKKVLIAEDNETNMNVLVKMLDKLGTYEIFEVYNGKEAIEIYKRESPDYVLMDIQMPVINGFEAIQKIREIEKEISSKSKIVAITAYATIDDKEKILSYGVDDYISKPLKIIDLKRIF